MPRAADLPLHYEMDFIDVLEMLGALCMGLVSLVGAILKGIWDTILGFFGWD